MFFCARVHRVPVSLCACVYWNSSCAPVFLYVPLCLCVWGQFFCSCVSVFLCVLVCIGIVPVLLCFSVFVFLCFYVSLCLGSCVLVCIGTVLLWVLQLIRLTCLTGDQPLSLPPCSFSKSTLQLHHSQL